MKPSAPGLRPTRLLADARATKDTAASRLRDARRGTNNARITEAEADYRAALALVLEREQGTRPTWAPKINVEQPGKQPIPRHITPTVP